MDIYYIKKIRTYIRYKFKIFKQTIYYILILYLFINLFTFNYFNIIYIYLEKT